MKIQLKPLKLNLQQVPKASYRNFSCSFSSSNLELFSFEDLCEVFDKIEATTKRLIINDILTDFFVKMMNDHPDELVACIYLCLCKVKF